MQLAVWPQNQHPVTVINSSPLPFMNISRFLHMKTNQNWHIVIRPGFEYSVFLVISTDRWPPLSWYTDRQTGSIYPNVIQETDKAIILQFIHLTGDRGLLQGIKVAGDIHQIYIRLMQASLGAIKCDAHQYWHRPLMDWQPGPGSWFRLILFPHFALIHPG